MHYFFKNIRKPFIYSAGIALGLLSSMAVLAWSGPCGASPTACNVSPPINTSGTIQSKLSGGSIIAPVLGATSICLGADCRSVWPTGGASQWTTSGSDIYYGTGRVGIGIAPIQPLHIGGAWTGAYGGAIVVNPTISSSATVSQSGLNLSSIMSPTGLSLSNLYSILSISKLSNSDTSITNDFGTYARLDSAADYTGTLTNGYTIFAGGSAVWNAPKPITNFYNFYANPIANGSGITAGTVTNTQAYLGTMTAAAGAGGTVVNYGLRINQPSGNTAGTSDYGIYITGNGGASATNNYSLYNNSTADSYFAGTVRATSFVYASDERFKTNIKTLSGALNKVLALRGVTFEWKDGTPKAGQEDIGVIAQEVEKVAPELVVTGSDGYKSVDYARAVPLLINAIREQQQQIDQLKARLDTISR